MKKILIAFDGTNFSKGAFEFVRRLNEIEPVLVTGVFMPQVDYANLWSYASAAGAGTGAVFIPLLEQEDTDMVAANIEHFEVECQKNNIRYRVHKDFFDFALPELKKETRFADVLVIGGELFYKDAVESNQFEHLKAYGVITFCEYSLAFFIFIYMPAINKFSQCFFSTGNGDQFIHPINTSSNFLFDQVGLLQPAFNCGEQVCRVEGF